LTSSVLALVLLAALIHAAWNTWLKLSGDRLAALAMLAAGWGCFGLLTIPVTGMPAPRSWPILLISVVVHTVYSLTLIRAYSHGKLSVVYPIARGVAPLIVTLVSVLFLGDSLGPWGIAGITLVIWGVVWLGIPRTTPDRISVVYAVLTGSCVGTYTLLDGVGARMGGAHAFAAWLFLLNSIPLILIALGVHGRDFFVLARPLWRKGVTAGLISATAFWIIIWALSVAPMGLVAALRESSVVFAALIGAAMLREPVRWAAIGLVFGGILLSRLS
jgi:drug/metabolite transporter (DMT)-like permease